MKITQGKINQILLVFAIVTLMFTTGYSQGQQFSSLTYSVSIPTGDTKEFIDEVSWRGLGFDYRYMFKRNLSVGFSTGWNLLYQDNRELTQLTDPPGAIYSKQYKLISSIPVMASIHYYFGKRRSIRPYVGVSAGGFIMRQYLEISLFLWENNEWQWGMAPEAGVLIPVDRDMSIIVNGKYNYAFTGESVMGTSINNAYWGINVGVAWQP